mmetsp:Transcript_6002/g.9086  ORF Transcript_6002/g.9086 Transcript_6002/m.9086 type:complete len:251 (-) Transcript_6002:126-878(-)|eukprot:CAMPEP_0201521246 /NCGR_PEP_ID=MMETSP0161_2-20130828/14306_1 /ASSEMBLY_ACC=CAM_ASM_000251 /TAXON_ID=180227 /ORGANISM="Neoparamoeba aestuarina, Strain SoJaBio B1-5/56/2" /LENGTH=250 /DNA_ID=CAMNT_0047919855 /DNA_START=166 /DNA_END=918 /DNA_ORIENTATION=-
MVNYPVRCVCFLFVGILFLLPVIFLVVRVNYEKIDEHDEWRETNCTFDPTIPASQCSGEKQSCATFALQPEDREGICTSACNGRGALLPLKRDDPVKDYTEVKCFYLIDGIETTTRTCIVTMGEMPPDCGSKTDDVFNDGITISDPDYQEGDRPRNNKRQNQGYEAPHGCVYVDAENQTSTVTYAPNGQATLRCITNGQELLERLDYGGLAILLEGFFVTFAAICFLGVGLATFVEKTPNNDAYCFNFKL